MKDLKTNAWSFATAKLQATIVKMLSILTIVAVIGFSMVACEQPEVEDDDGWFSVSGSSVKLYNNSSYTVTVNINHGSPTTIRVGSNQSFSLSSGSTSVSYSPKDKVKARRHSIDVTTWYFENK